jgi:hypothetical protein
MTDGMILKHSFRHGAAVALRYGFSLIAGTEKNVCSKTKDGKWCDLSHLKQIKIMPDRI